MMLLRKPSSHETVDASPQPSNHLLISVRGAPNLTMYEERRLLALLQRLERVVTASGLPMTLDISLRYATTTTKTAGQPATATNSENT